MRCIFFMANNTVKFVVILIFIFTWLSIFNFVLPHKWFNYFLLFLSICLHYWKSCTILLPNNIVKGEGFSITIKILLGKRCWGLFLCRLISRFFVYLWFLVIFIWNLERLYSMHFPHMTVQTIILCKRSFANQAKWLIFIAFPHKIGINIFLISFPFNLFFSLLYLFSSQLCNKCTILILLIFRLLTSKISNILLFSIFIKRHIHWGLSQIIHRNSLVFWC